MILFNTLWQNYPDVSDKPCNENLFINQCAIRMSVALYFSDMDLSSFTGAKCWGPHPNIRKQHLKTFKVDAKEIDQIINLPYYKPLKKDADSFRHFLRAQEIANWMDTKPNIFGIKKVFKRKDNPNMDHLFFSNKKGILFILDGWGYTDHIDIWNGFKMKSGYLNYFSKGKEIWLWELI